MDHIKEAIRSMGTDLGWRTIARTYLLYRREWSDRSRLGIQVEKDIAYGPHPRHRLDIYTPLERPAPIQPMVVYVHGGGFVQGDKSREPNVGYYFARHGMLVLCINYRLAPADKWPAGSRDLAVLVEWIGLNMPGRGGDPRKVFLLGHSAGAAHVAAYLCIPGFRLSGDDGVRGAVLLSGPTYDTSCLNPRKDYPYYGPDRRRHPAMSVVRHIASASWRDIPAIFIAYAEFDPPEIAYQARTLFNCLARYSHEKAVLKQLPDHNHISEIMHFNSGDEALGPVILDFFKDA